MPDVYLASSALAKEKFDCLRTVEEGINKGFDGVQLYIDPSLRNGRYLTTLVQELAASRLGLLLHLPDILAADDLIVARKLMSQFPESRMLIHYQPWTRPINLAGRQAGWENSVTGKYDPIHILEAMDQATIHNSFFVFDIGRSLYARDKNEIRQITNFTLGTIKSLDPHQDVIHADDKSTWTGSFREEMCILGVGICAAFVEALKAYRGTVVLEHEDLGMAVASLGVLRGL